MALTNKSDGEKKGAYSLNIFCLVLNPEQQSPTIQNWLHLHIEAIDIEDGIETVFYQAEDHQTLCKVIFHVEGMLVHRLEGDTHVVGILAHRFNWSRHRAERFPQDFGQLLDITLPGMGHVYYARVLDLDACEIRIDFS